MAGVTLEGIRKVYAHQGGVQVAVERLDLTVADGEFVVLVGPSGCGKTTALRIMAGLETPTAGTVRIGDRVVNEVPPSQRDIAMVFQNYALYPHMTVYDNLAFALSLRRVGRAEIDAQVRKAAALLGLDELLDRKPRQLSGGQRQRVAVGRAIVRQPQVFLFDEPLSNLDAKLRVQMRRELAALRRRLGTTTVYVTHDQVEAMTLGDRIVVMRAGQVQQVDTPLTVYQRPANAFVATFVGSPPMNLIRGGIMLEDGAWFVADNRAFRLPLNAAALADLPAPGMPVILGVRPEALRPVSEGAGPVARVEHVEPLGNETLVSLDAGGVSLSARVDAGMPIRPGEMVRLTVEPGAFHWFDAERDARLG